MAQGREPARFRVKSWAGLGVGSQGRKRAVRKLIGEWIEYQENEAQELPYRYQIVVVCDLEHGLEVKFQILEVNCVCGYLINSQPFSTLNLQL